MFLIPFILYFFRLLLFLIFFIFFNWTLRKRVITLLPISLPIDLLIYIFFLTLISRKEKKYSWYSIKFLFLSGHDWGYGTLAVFVKNKLIFVKAILFKYSLWMNQTNRWGLLSGYDCIDSETPLELKSNQVHLSQIKYLEVMIINVHLHLLLRVRVERVEVRV